MQFPGQGKAPVGIVFDSDMGNSIDDALALALLYGFDGKNEVRVVSVSVSKSNLKSAGFSEAVGRFYAGAASGAFGAVGRTLPIGMAANGKLADDTPMLVQPLAKMTADGKPVYNHGIEHVNDTAEVGALIRNAFTSQPDQNCIVVLAGPATNLAEVLRVPGAKEWIEKKVKFLVFAGGAYAGGGPEPHVKADIPAAKKLFAEWPTPIVASGHDVGAELLFPGASIEKDFAWSTDHPVVDAYRAAGKMPYDAPTWAMTAVLYAAHPEAGYFKISDPGVITVADDGRTTFTPSPSGKHRHLILDPAQKDRVIKTYIEVASAKPVVRAPRRRPNQQQQQQQQQNQIVQPPPAAEVKPPAQ